jgi:hypothetical protein
MRSKYFVALFVPLLMATLLIPGVSAVCDPTPPPPPCGTGYTPGFWKHNIGVYLEENPGKYSAFDDGTKLTDAMIEAYDAIVPGTLEDAYAALRARGKGSSIIRADMANAFNAAAGFGPFED